MRTVRTLETCVWLGGVACIGTAISFLDTQPKVNIPNTLTDQSIETREATYRCLGISESGSPQTIQHWWDAPPS